MSKTDPFTLRRLEKFIEDYRVRTGQLPTLQDFETGGFAKAVIDPLVRDELLVQLYVTLTNGTIVKGYKLNRG